MYEVDLELLESSVEEVAIDNGTVSVSVVGNSLQINSKTPISMVEIYNISGVKLHSSEMLERAVKGMLPKNRIGRQMIKKLRVYKDAEHGHEAQKPEVLEVK